MSNEHNPEADRTESRPRRSRRSRGIALFAVLVLVIAGVAFLVHERRVNVRGALELIKEGSEEAATTAGVKTALALSQRVSAFDVDVDTQGGVVRLEGTVPSEDVREIAIAIARDTAGVESVEDELLVDPETQPSAEIARLRQRIRDLEIRATLESALERAPRLADRDLSFSVADATVTLEGTVEDSEEKRGTEEIAERIDGVVDVVNHIEVAATRAAPTAPEAGLDKRAEFALFATDAFDLDRVHLRVDERGVAILTGEVRSQAERLLAERVVAEVDGIERVDNRLDVLAVFREA
jgi:osmotically-inducible protein OsmY